MRRKREIVKGGKAYVVLLLRDLRTLIDFSREGVSDSDGSALLGKYVQELVIHALLDEDTRTSTASLTMVPAIRDE